MAKPENNSIKFSPHEAFSAIKLTLSLSLKTGRKDFILNAVVQIIHAVTPAISAVLSGMLLNAIVTAISTHVVWPIFELIAALMAISVLTTILDNWSQIITDNAIYNTNLYVSKLIATKYASIPLEVRENKDFADRFERVQDYGNSVRWITTAVTDMVSALIAFFTAFIVMLMVSTPLAIIVVLVTVPYVVIDFLRFRNQTAHWRQFSTHRRRAWRMFDLLTLPTTSQQIQQNGLTDYFIKEANRDYRLAQEADLTFDRKMLKPKLATASLEQIVRYGALGYITIKIVFGKMPIGEFVTINALLSQLSGSAESFFRLFGRVNSDLVKANDFTTFMNETEIAAGGVKLEPGKVPRLEFRDVSFSYPNNDNLVLKNITFTIEPGESLAIVGENGAGKTTLVKLLMGFYKPKSGQILINDIPIEQIDRTSLFQQFGTLFQDYINYNFASLADNIWFGDIAKKPEPTALQRALDRAGLGDLSTHLPKGFKQILSKDFDKDFSADLSGGQWQRLALARGFFRDANVLILDEPTSAVDAKAEYHIFKEIMDQHANHTTIIISHRFSTVRKARHIIVLDEGQIIERGTHHQLMKNDGLYREMFELQAEGYKN
ncbi:ABC transporter ATP-binding protein/permease [Candidatus Saccharibacteria bacterium]|nr:ABC transporter ATP-binding protein/permease [Candidatus Saccharibacteria bacterium]